VYTRYNKRNHIGAKMPIHNFSAGPAILPAAVLEQVQAELRDYQGLGVSIMELSHRSAEYEQINQLAEQRFKKLAGVGNGYRAIFLQGGASTQFAMLPMNCLPAGASADYSMTGAWAEKAAEEAGKLGNIRPIGSTKATGYNRVPTQPELEIDPAAAYLHITSNETIHGTQWHQWPDAGGRPLVADMSSDIFSRPLDASAFDLIYAGAQKNLGPSGLVVVLVREAFLENANPHVPTMLRYSTHIKNNSLYNTPPTFAVYVLGLVLEWIEEFGGLAGMQRRNQYKADLIYNTIDTSAGFYRGHAEPQSRSLMNITFRLPSEALEQRFVAESASQGMLGLAGHRSVGGIRASIYNALEPNSCLALAQFMAEFARRNG
jgi:phosphoserine aminotransferase